ncbi:ACT domain-containing protein ACR2 isoform X1 [Musa acuminata AAA Group]|uniref:ACT domain-containing protein ACR2 isoform X1 n=2 Tax=Musa acuminata AAA Group TaxID=214697 RepID=UPI0031D4652E
MEVCTPYFDPEYENLNDKIFGPRVSVDNESCEKCTVVKVDSINKQGLLLKVVQVLTDMDLFITKSYISSDARWFMDVFHVKDKLGNKVTNGKVIKYVQQAIGERRELQNSEEAEYCSDDDSGIESSSERTAIEMIGVNRPGLFSEISAALAEQRCNVIEAHAWSHNAFLACIACISDESTSTCIDDPQRLSAIEDHLSNILGPSFGGDDSGRSARTCFLGCDNWTSHAERRLHQLMLANQDFDGPQGPLNMSSWTMNVDNYEEGRRTVVSIDRCKEKGYTVVNVECLDRPKLMFDTVCTLTDMQYVVFHANITSHGPFAHQEYFIRRKDGRLLDTELEIQRVSKCLEAAIERRVCEGIRLELDLQNNVRVLPYVTQTLREHGLTVAQADIAAHGEKTKNVFFIQDISGKEIDMGMVESMKKELEPLSIQVENAMLPQKFNSMERDRFSFVSLLRTQLERFSHNFISI